MWGEVMRVMRYDAPFLLKYPAIAPYFRPQLITYIVRRKT